MICRSTYSVKIKVVQVDLFFQYIKYRRKKILWAQYSSQVDTRIHKQMPPSIYLIFELTNAAVYG